MSQGKKHVTAEELNAEAMHTTYDALRLLGALIRGEQTDPHTGQPLGLLSPAQRAKVACLVIGSHRTRRLQADEDSSSETDSGSDGPLFY